MHLVGIGFSSFSMRFSDEIYTVHLTLSTVRLLSMLICELFTRIFVYAADKMLSVSDRRQSAANVFNR